ncbi:MAG: CBS domain-containing protein [Humibacillus sp.]|nr:CBS domain-containing protein [Humibacillus sp.]MDN5775574.1 CBS domain-containing protein [Humibacillus sp.]
MDRSQPRPRGQVAETAGEIMSTPVHTVSPGDPVGTVADLLRSKEISGVPVIDAAGALLGLVSEYDLLAKSGATAADVMTTSVISVSAGTPIADVRHLLVDRRIRRVPVVVNGELVGIVSRGDVVALLATEWVCQVCGEAVRGDHPPEVCPRCHAGSNRFVLEDQSPGF